MKRERVIPIVQAAVSGLCAALCLWWTNRAAHSDSWTGASLWALAGIAAGLVAVRLAPAGTSRSVGDPQPTQ